MDNLLVSIIIPVYNAEKYIAECLNSAINQTYSYIEILIIDDGSSDSSLRIAKSFQSEKVAVFNQKNKGASSARNLGLRKAKGQYIQFLDADDLLHPDKIKYQIEILKNKPNWISVCPTVYFKSSCELKTLRPTHDWLISVSNNPIEFITALYGGSDNGPKHGGMVQPNAWLTPKSIIDKVGIWNEELTLDDDGEFFCRVIIASDGILYSKDSINFYRKHENYNNLSATQTKKGYESEIKSIDLKSIDLNGLLENMVFNKIFGRFYWSAGFNYYPQYDDLTTYCIRKANELGYNGEKYIGGKNGKILAKLVGWKIARRLLKIRQSVS